MFFIYGEVAEGKLQAKHREKKPDHKHVFYHEKRNPPRPAVYRCTVGGQKSGSIPDPHQPKQLYILKGEESEKIALVTDSVTRSCLFFYSKGC